MSQAVPGGIDDIEVNPPGQQPADQPEWAGSDEGAAAYPTQDPAVDLAELLQLPAAELDLADLLTEVSAAAVRATYGSEDPELTLVEPAVVAARKAQILEQTRRLADSFQAALTNQAVIDQAIGILISNSGLSAHDALALLRARSRQEHSTLSATAAELVKDAVRRARARHVDEK